MATHGPNAEHKLREFVRGAVPKIKQLLKNREPYWVTEPILCRGPDGHFRESARRTLLFDIPSEITSGIEYRNVIDALKTDAVIACQLDRMIGTQAQSQQIDGEQVVRGLLFAMVNDEGSLEFTDELFDRKWRRILDFFQAEKFATTTVVPLPRLKTPAFPLRLNDELVLDRFTEDEVTRCHEAGIIRPLTRRFPMVNADVAVGLRRRTWQPKILEGVTEPARDAAPDEGRFGHRPALMSHLVVDDVLVALRLFKHAAVRAAGYASWTDSWGGGGTSFREFGQWPYHGNYVLSETEVGPFQELWSVLEGRAGPFSFSIHRFNLAFDRGLAVDRIVDLVIAVESLFLRDVGLRDRGELRFRFALRAAKFIEHPLYDEREVYRVMRRAYDARSAVVHGGQPEDTSLPDNEAATLPEFTDTIEELVRQALRKALAMEAGAARLRDGQYWEQTLLKGR